MSERPYMFSKFGAKTMARSVDNLYNAMIEEGYFPHQAWEFVLAFYKGAGDS